MGRSQETFAQHTLYSLLLAAKAPSTALIAHDLTNQKRPSLSGQPLLLLIKILFTVLQTVLQLRLGEALSLEYKAPE